MAKKEKSWDMFPNDGELRKPRKHWILKQLYILRNFSCTLIHSWYWRTLCILAGTKNAIHQQVVEGIHLSSICA